MDDAFNSAFEYLDVETLSKKEAKEIFTYINFRLDSNSDCSEVIKMMKIRNELENHLFYLDSLVVKTL